MLSFNKLSFLLEKKNYYYSLPTSNKEQLYDFYACEFLNSHLDKTTIGSSDFKGGSYMEVDSPTLRLGISDDIWESFDMVKKTLLPHLKENLLNASFFAIAAEVRYAFKQDIVNKVNKHPKMDTFITDYYNEYNILDDNIIKLTVSTLNSMYDEETLISSYDRTRSVRKTLKIMLKNDWTLTDIVQICRDLFETPGWNRNYGGPAWANVCEGWLMLNKARTEQQLFTYIDHMYDLQHNNGTIFNKVAAFKELNDYANDVDFTWIAEALNFKRDLKSPLEYVNKISRSFKPIFTRLLKSLGYEGSQNKEAEQLKIDAMFDILRSEEFTELCIELNKLFNTINSNSWCYGNKFLNIFGPGFYVGMNTSILIDIYNMNFNLKNVFNTTPITIQEFPNSFYELISEKFPKHSMSNVSFDTILEFFKWIKKYTETETYKKYTNPKGTLVYWSYSKIRENYNKYENVIIENYNELKPLIFKKIDLLDKCPIKFKNIKYDNNGNIDKKYYNNTPLLQMDDINIIQQNNIKHHIINSRHLSN